MLLAKLAFAAAILTFKAAAAPTPDQPVLLTRSTTKSYQAPTELNNVTTYHVLTRVPASIDRSFHSLMRRAIGGYGVSTTTYSPNSTAWSTPVLFGSQTFDLIMDTGSADTWAVAKGAKCLNPADGSLTAQGQSGCSLGPNWDVAKSACVPVPKENFNIPYGGSINNDQGMFCKIDVTIGGITAKNQQVAAVTNVGFQGGPPTSGVLGLAYPALTFSFSGTDYSADVIGENQVPYDPVFTTMYKQKHIPPVFSMALSRPSSLRKDDGYIAFGGLAPVITYGNWGVAPIETVSINGSGYYLPTVLPYPSPEFYTLTPDAFLYQSSDKPIYDPTKWLPLPEPDHSLPSNVGEGQYIIDSGTSLVYLAEATANALNAQFNPPAVFNSSDPNGGYSVPCKSKPPWFAIKIGGVIFPMDKKDMITSDGFGGCISAISSGGVLNGPYTIGDPWMVNVMVVFDVGAAQLKFRSRGLYL